MKGFCVALGLFDCVHKGHRKVLEEAVSIAVGNDLTAAAVTFDDESLGLLHKTQIYNLSTRKLLMQSVGIKEIFAYRFDEKLKNVAAIDFLKELARKGAKHFVFGCDYSCGSDRKTGKQVAKICNEIGVKSTIVPVLMIDGEKISSSRISKLLLDGNIDAANAMLGQPFFISGTVIHGREVGRKNPINSIAKTLPYKSLSNPINVFSIDGASMPKVGLLPMLVSPAYVFPSKQVIVL